MSTGITGGGILLAITMIVPFIFGVVAAFTIFRIVVLREKVVGIWATSLIMITVTFFAPALMFANTVTSMNDIKMIASFLGIFCILPFIAGMIVVAILLGVFELIGLVIKKQRKQ